MNFLQKMVADQKNGVATGIYSCCSANESVLRAALARGKANRTPVLIEATANQVNQYGGYTGMKPADFYAYVKGLVREIGISEETVILGGDHLGPLTWSGLPEAEAMEKAKELVESYVLAGFEKIHLDTSMWLADDSRDEPLSDAVIARRGAELCAVAEQAYASIAGKGAKAPCYIIGSEVPIPGGAQEAEDGISVTRPEDCRRTIAVFQEEFTRRGLSDAWSRVIGVVVQPGVEFGDAEVFDYNREKAAALTAVLAEYPAMVFEGHSTDYQTRKGLRQMVEDGIAILKVGPALTFGMREAVLALEQIEKALLSGKNIWLSDFNRILEATMLEKPENWQKHYHGTAAEKQLARTYSYSDRARYYMPEEAVKASIARLMKNLREAEIPDTLLSQYLPLQYSKVREGVLSKDPEALIEDRIGNYIDDYLFATGQLR